MLLLSISVNFAYSRLRIVSQVSMRLARLLSARPSTTVHSIFRNEAHIPEVAETGAKPIVLSLEDANPIDFAEIFKNTRANVVYFSAGAGGKGGLERTKKVDQEGAIKVFDAIELVKEAERPRLIMVSAIDVRDPDRIPEHYVRLRNPSFIRYSH